MELQVFKNEAALISSRDTQSLIGAFLGGLDVKESSTGEPLSSSSPG